MNNFAAERSLPGQPRLSEGLRHRLAVWSATLAVVVIVAGCALAAQRVGGFARARHAEHTATSTRDAALEAAVTGVAGFNTIDYRHPDDTVGRWLRLSTGRLHASVARSRSALIAQIRTKRTVSTARVVASGLTAYSTGGRTATVVVVLSVVSGRMPATEKRFAASLSGAHGTWRLTAIQPIEARA